MIGLSKYYRAVRKFAVTVPSWGIAIRHDVLPDEIYDLTLICRRVYGNSTETLTVMAAAGLDRLDQALVVGTTITLPTASQISQLKAQTGYPVKPPVKVR